LTVLHPFFIKSVINLGCLLDYLVQGFGLIINIKHPILDLTLQALIKLGYEGRLVSIQVRSNLMVNSSRVQIYKKRDSIRHKSAAP